MPVDAVLIIRVWVLEVIRQTGDGDELEARGCIEIGVTKAIVPGCVPVTQVNDAVRVVITDGNAPSAVKHEIVHTLIPFQRNLWRRITERRELVADTALIGEADRSQSASY
jgi:hypothetical protein